MKNLHSKYNDEVNNKEEQTPVPKKSLFMDIYTFEDGIRKGLYSDSKGTAHLILNGTLYASYNIYIDRLCVTKSGSVVSFEGLLKYYENDEIKIQYDFKEARIRSQKVYVSNNRRQKNRRR
ncbi:MAG: hypothetical protein K6D38_04230 [Pseudobutyrivibrio sp.]|nr:hypothetical protein [Pseudobutyrivibrio sp.]